MRYSTTTARLARAGGALTALLVAGLVSYAPMASAQPTPPGGGGGSVTNPEPCNPDLGPCGPTDPCDGEAPPEDCPPPPDPCEDGQAPVDGECPPPPDPCEGDTPADDCPVPCEDGQAPVDGECPAPPDPCGSENPPPDECGNGNSPDPGGHGTIDQPVPGTPTFTG
jgi:hypothetical protein